MKPDLTTMATPLSSRSPPMYFAVACDYFIRVVFIFKRTRISRSSNEQWFCAFQQSRNMDATLTNKGFSPSNQQGFLAAQTNKGFSQVAVAGQGRNYRDKFTNTCNTEGQNDDVFSGYFGGYFGSILGIQKICTGCHDRLFKCNRSHTIFYE